ncbi:hypothetical protein BKA69DRAFT_1046656 [Paraphysoderma sedebokerense]|nr:hypothetical protein BKA69DRAFT_1046656 [Paraphysoderma sedebokerense]
MFKTQLLTRLYSFLLLWNFVLYAVFGSPLPAPDGSVPNKDQAGEVVKDPRKYLPEDIPVGIIFITVGVLFCFWGSRWFKIVLFLAGAYLFASIAYFVLQKVEPEAGFSNRSAVYLGVTIAAGFIGGAILTAFVKLGIFAIGCVGGYALAVWILGLGANGLIKNDIGQKVFIAAVALISGFITLFWLMDRAVKIFTAIAGAYSIMLGIDVFAQTGFKDAVGRFVGDGTLPYNPTPAIYGMLAGTAVLALVGMAVQFKVTGKGRSIDKK